MRGARRDSANDETTSNPTLCRVDRYLLPGFPRPTMQRRFAGSVLARELFLNAESIDDSRFFKELCEHRSGDAIFYRLSLQELQALLLPQGQQLCRLQPRLSLLPLPQALPLHLPRLLQVSYPWR